MSKLQHDFNVWLQGGGVPRELSSNQLRAATQVARSAYPEEAAIGGNGERILPVIKDLGMATFMLDRQRSTE